MMEKVTISEKQEQTINEFKRTLSGFSEEVLAEVILGNYKVEEKYKVGDFVSITAKSSCEGNVYEVIGTRSEGVYLLKMSPTSNMLWHIGEFRHATPEEIKAEQERRVWAGIVREVGELRKGDVYISKDDLTYSYDGLERNKFFYDMYNSGKFKGFYPVESFISFGGESHDS